MFEDTVYAKLGKKAIGKYNRKLWIDTQRKQRILGVSKCQELRWRPQKGYAMFKLTTNDAEGQTPKIIQSLDELARVGARRAIAAALESKVEQYVEAQRHLRDENGHALVVRNGRSHHERTVQMEARKGS